MVRMASPRVWALLSLAVMIVAVHSARAGSVQASAGRHLLQGPRQFSKVAVHKSPDTPKLSRKSFERKAPKRALLESQAAAADEAALEQDAGRHLLQGPRQFSKVAAHKSPGTPKLSRKSFERRAPKRALLESQAAAADSELDLTADGEAASRHLLQGRGGLGAGSGVGSGGGGDGHRAFSEVAAHKQPRQPRNSRKSYERKMPSGRHLLQTEDAHLADSELDLAADGEAASRHLLQGRGGLGAGSGVGSGGGGDGHRAFSEVAAHKQPRQPRNTRKSYERKMPSGRHLLQGRGGLGAGSGVGSGGGGDGHRAFSEVAAHKQPRQPRNTRKSYERKMPSGRKAQ